jgi:VWFA-related protein
VIVNAKSPRGLVVEDAPIPEDWPVKPPWMARALLDEILAGKKAIRRAEKSRPKKERPEPEEEIGEHSGALTIEEGLPKFSSSVRMVTLNAAVYDAQGRPLLDLKREDFEVIEDGKRQELEFAGSEEVPFNLALLLDMSGSTRRDREAMKTAAKRFVDVARPQDKTAAYALANNLFQLVSPLGGDKDKQKELIEAIPQVSGGSPLYDMIVLAYGHELRQLPLERNALIVISDGVDNRVYGTGTASVVGFRELLRGAEAMNTLVYPIFLDQFTAAPPPRWAKRAKGNMEKLADATGGRLFVARSVRDLDPVYPQVAEELRSVYTLAYYPEEQEFDGRWRRVQVRVKRDGATVRTREGYFAE